MHLLNVHIITYLTNTYSMCVAELTKTGTQFTFC